MGALHDGHVSLVRRAREVADCVVLSVFVNPKQFGAGEDFERYPRNLSADAEIAAGEGVDYVFAPSAAEMYPQGFATTVRVERLSDVMCGATRKGHFDGVALVVLKLLDIVCPDIAVLGQKDYQQTVIVRRLVTDLNLGVEIMVAPTLREADGLALSSRNAYLTPQQRKAAVVLRRSLDEAERLFAAGERKGAVIEAAVRRVLESEPLAKIEYVSVADPTSLQPLAKLADEAAVTMAVHFGGTRLIDNTLLRVART